MPVLGLGTNISLLVARRNLDASTSALASSTERLSSGSRINHASDDAAGLSIASALQANARVFSQGLRNLNDGISALSIAHGALSQLTQIVTRQMELAEQAANGVYSTAQRNALDREAGQLTNEYNRIVATTKFNGNQLLGTSNASIRIQAGIGIDESILIDTGSSIGASSISSTSSLTTDGTYQSATSLATSGNMTGVQIGDTNGDGKNDIIASNYTNGEINVFLGNGNNTFKAVSTYTMGRANAFEIADLNGDGAIDVVGSLESGGGVSVLLGNGNGTFKARFTYHSGAKYGVNLADFDRDGDIDIAAQSFGSANIAILLNNGNGTFLAPLINTANDAIGITSGDFNADGYLDIVNGNSQLLLGNGNGTFNYRFFVGASGNSGGVAAADFNNDGKLDLAVGDLYEPSIRVFLGNGNGTFKVPFTAVSSSTIQHGLSAADINADGKIDLLSADGTKNTVGYFLGNGNGTFGAHMALTGSVSDSWDLNIETGDLNGDGVADIAGSGYGGGNISIYISNTTTSSTSTSTSTSSSLSLTTQSGARSALTTLSDMLQSITNTIGQIGGYQSRLESALSSLGSKRQTYLAAESRIRDADIAFESSVVVQNKIRQQVATAIFAQANQAAQLIPQLLR